VVVVVAACGRLMTTTAPAPAIPGFPREPPSKDIQIRTA